MSEPAFLDLEDILLIHDEQLGQYGVRLGYVTLDCCVHPGPCAGKLNSRRVPMARLSAALFAGLLTLAPSASWLDQASPVGWNRPGAAVPDAPDPRGESATSERCRTVARTPTLAGDQAVHAKGWTLFGPGQVFGATEVVLATAGVDGMCRPIAFQGFVFSQGKLAGTISPYAMSSRTDGAALLVQLRSEDRVDVEFARYASADPLCCPSRVTTVSFRLERTANGSVLTPQEARTSPAPGGR